MKTLLSRLQNLIAKEHGPTTVEYALMLGLIVLTCCAAISAMGTQMSTALHTIAGVLQ